MDIKYTIKMHSWWHCGSGLAAGGDADVLTIKDADGLPFIPGKTFKGLVREAAEEISPALGYKADVLTEVFGQESSVGTKTFFSDAVIVDGRQKIVENALAPYMFCNIASTKLENGVAADSSLRQIEVTVPCELEGCILSVPERAEELIENSLRYIKRLGFNRNRGLGRCTILFEKI